MAGTADAEDHDFSIVIGNPPLRPDAWHWEIYRLGRKTSIQRSSAAFKTMAAADAAGKAAFRRLMVEFNS